MLSRVEHEKSLLSVEHEKSLLSPGLVQSEFCLLPPPNMEASTVLFAGMLPAISTTAAELGQLWWDGTAIISKGLENQKARI